jgi:hypothetical protein
MDNRAFDGVVTRHLVAHGDVVVIHGFHLHAYRSRHRATVARIEARDPRSLLRGLASAWVQQALRRASTRWDEGQTTSISSQERSGRPESKSKKTPWPPSFWSPHPAAYG